MSTTRGLIRLIKASSGTEGVATNSFRNNVTASANGVGMADYKIGGVSWNNYPQAPPYTYASGDSFSISASLSEFGSKATTIQETSTSAWAITATTYEGGVGAATLTGLSWTSNQPTLTIQMTGAVTPGTPTTTVNSPWYSGYYYPNTPWGTTCSSPTDCSCVGAECTTGYTVDLVINSGSIAASGTSSMYVNTVYTPDHYTAGFNPQYTNAGVLSNFIVSVNRIANTAVPLEIHWYSDYIDGTQVGTDYTYSFTSYADTYVTYYYKFRKSGSSDAYQSGSITWQDPRPDA